MSASSKKTPKTDLICFCVLEMRVVPIFQKGDQGVCSIYKGITLLSLPSKVNASVLERKVRLLVEPWLQEEQSGFCAGRRTLDQLSTLEDTGGCMGVCPTTTCILWKWTRHLTVSLGVSRRRCVGIMGCLARCYSPSWWRESWVLKWRSPRVPGVCYC